MGPCHQRGRIFKRTASLDFYVVLTVFSILNPLKCQLILNLSNGGGGAGCSSLQTPPFGEGCLKPRIRRWGTHSCPFPHRPGARSKSVRSALGATGPGCERWLCSLLCDHRGAMTLSGPPCALCEVMALTEQLISRKSFHCEIASLSDVVALSPPLLPPPPFLSPLSKPTIAHLDFCRSLLSGFPSNSCKD